MVEFFRFPIFHEKYKKITGMEAIGYFGQSVEFFGDERIAYVSGSGICIHHLQNGTVEMIWRSETGICTFKYHATTNKLALCHDVAGACIEITQLPDHSRLFAELENPTSDRISDFSFSHEGDRLVESRIFLITNALYGV